MGIKDSPEEEEIEIRPGVKVIYLNTNPMFALTNFLNQSIGMWLWKYALCPYFEERIKTIDLVRTISLCYPKGKINSKSLGKIINCTRLKSAKIQYGTFDRAYGWKWNGKEDLATSMWLFTKTWIYTTEVVLWNNNTAVAPGNESRQDIEEELMALDFHRVVDAYYTQRLQTYKEFMISSSL